MLQVAIALTATADSAGTVVTHGVVALCQVPGRSPVGGETPIESVFEAAAGAELTNALYGSRERFASGAITESTPPRYRSCPIPDFPDYLLVELTKAYIDVEMTVGSDGRVDAESIEISERTSPAVQEAVREAVARCRFEPATENGIPVSSPFRYRLELRRG